MNPIQQLYFVLRVKALQDPMIANLFQGIISWNDAAASAEEEAQLSEYLQTNDGATYLSAINAELNRFHLRNQEIPTPPPSPILPPCMESLYNPKGVRTLIVRNLPRDITKHELVSIFEKHGVLCDVYIPLNKDQNSPYFETIRGFATIKFLTSQESTRAFMAETSALMIRNKKIAIEFAKEDHWRQSRNSQ